MARGERSRHRVQRKVECQEEQEKKSPNIPASPGKWVCGVLAGGFCGAGHEDLWRWNQREGGW